MKRRRVSSDKRNAAIEIGQKIKCLRETNKFSQKTLGENIGVPQSTISTWELGLNIPDAFELFRLAELFQVDVSEFKPEIIIPNKTEKSEVLDKVRYLEEELQNLKLKIGSM